MQLGRLLASKRNRSRVFTSLTLTSQQALKYLQQSPSILFLYNFPRSLIDRCKRSLHRPGTMASHPAMTGLADPVLLSKIDKFFELGIGQYVNLPQVCTPLCEAIVKADLSSATCRW